MMYRARVVLRVLATASGIFTTILGMPTLALAEPRPEEQVRQILLARNADLRVALLKAWLRPSDPRSRTQVDALRVDVYASEMRLHALGLERKMVSAGVSVTEVPYRVLSERAGVDLDLWPIFAGRTFAVPTGLTR